MIGRILLAIVALPIVVLLVLVLMRGKAERRDYEEQVAGEEQLVYPDFNPDAAAHITISSLTNNVIDFRKISGYWMVADGGAFSLPGDDTEEAAEGEEIGRG